MSKARVSAKKSVIKASPSIPSARLTVGGKNEITVPPLDCLTVKILSLQLADEDSRHYAIKVTFFDQLILSGIIKPTHAREKVLYKTLAKGIMNYDPSDHEKMCLFADHPLIVNIQPLKDFETGMYDGQSNTPMSVATTTNSQSQNRNYSYLRSMTDISCCNVDILPIFIDTDTLCVKKRLEPVIKPTIRYRKSWDNLPLITMQLTTNRDESNVHHHDILKKANYMRFTLVGAYNMLIPHEDSFQYVAATKMPISDETHWYTEMFSNGRSIPRKFNSVAFYPKWEKLRCGEEVFNDGDEKVVYELKDIIQDPEIDISSHIYGPRRKFSNIWGSFHRTLVLGASENWLVTQFRRWRWPFEFHVLADNVAVYSFMAFLNLFKLLYPGETKVCVAVPLHWSNPELMRGQCGCEALMTTILPSQKASKVSSPSPVTTPSTECGAMRFTGPGESNAFIIVEVKLARPLVKLKIPPPIPRAGFAAMLEELEGHGRYKRECTGRGQLVREWQATVRNAASSLRRVPHYGMTEFCLFNRQLSETRTRVELSTSFWLDAAVYVNNNFVVKNFMKSEEMFEEMLMMSHACLMKSAFETLIGVDNWQDLDPTLKAARQARQLQDIPHAMELYLQLVTEKPYNGNHWRELATCMKDVDREWASVCIDEALKLNIRHPLTILAKGCMVFEEDPDAAEPFFMALLAWFPFWSTAWVITNAYFGYRELYRMADEVLVYLKMTQDAGMKYDEHCPRVWERELGDWFETPPLLHGTSPYYDAVDLLLRIRALKMAEVCMAHALTEAKESAVSFHLLAMCCRLEGRIDDALCHVQRGINKFAEDLYLRSLEAECLHKKKDIAGAAAIFDKFNLSSGLSILLSVPSREPQRARFLLVDLVRRQPSAYAWVALAEDWISRAEVIGEAGDAGLTEEQHSAVVCARACAVQALKFDRRSARAWALLAKYVKPSARRLHCRTMAIGCGYVFKDGKKETSSMSEQSLCHRLGMAYLSCDCCMCKHLCCLRPELSELVANG